jgi:hypothetical protein
MPSVFRRAVADTIAHFGTTKEVLIGAPLVFFAGLGISLYRRGRAAMPDVWEALLHGIIAVLLASVSVFLWQLACAPYRNERDKRLSAEAQLRNAAEALQCASTQGPLLKGEIEHVAWVELVVAYLINAQLFRS